MFDDPRKSLHRIEDELLDEELTARFFAGRGSHIVFPCDSSLIFS